MHLKYDAYDLKFDEVFAVSANARTGTEVIYLELEINGMVGYGEASFPPYMKEKRADNLIFLEALDFTKFKDVDDLASIQNYINSVSNYLPAKAALDMALLDLKGKMNNTAVRSFFVKSPNKPIPTSFTIGIGDNYFILRQLTKAYHFPSLKVKLNSDPLYIKHTIALIQAHSKQPIGVDFNQGIQDKYLALELLIWLSEQGIEYAEQPMPDHLIHQFDWLKQNSPIPIYGDESIQTIEDIDNKHQFFHGVNIKLMKCGGLSNAFKMIERARSYNLKLMLGCMAESVCAITAAANLADLFDKVDLDGHLMMTNDLFTGVAIDNGHLILSSNPGLGVVKK